MSICCTIFSNFFVSGLMMSINVNCADLLLSNFKICFIKIILKKISSKEHVTTYANSKPCRSKQNIYWIVLKEYIRHKGRIK